MPEYGAAALSCRSLRDHKLCRAPLPFGSTVQSCESCSEKVVVSEEGWRLIEKSHAGTLFILCAPCCLIVAKVISLSSRIDILPSSHVIEQASRSEAVKKMMSAFLDIAEHSGKE